MAITFTQLQELMTKEGLKFFIAPDRPVVRFSVGGACGQYEIVLHVQEEGSFLQFRTVGYLSCPSGHASLNAVLQALGAINYQQRFVKFGWDPSDGEIVAYGDIWIMDSGVTQSQFSRMMNNYLPGIDTAYARIKTAFETGKDPGKQDPQALLAQRLAAAGSALPPELRELLEQLRKSGEAKPPDRPPAGDKPEIKEI